MEKKKLFYFESRKFLYKKEVSMRYKKSLVNFLIIATLHRSGVIHKRC